MSNIQLSPILLFSSYDLHVTGGYSRSNEPSFALPHLWDMLTSVMSTEVKHLFCFAGLAKPMGLVEGPGGLGQGGAAATLGEDSRESEGRYEEYGYNAQLSDRISLDRNIPDYRPKK